MDTIKNMAVEGIITRDKHNLYKVVTWDNAYLDIKTKVCDMDEVKQLAKEYVPVDSINEEILKRKVVSVTYHPIFDVMTLSWIYNSCSFMYAYFDCLRWCLANNVGVTVGAQAVTQDNVQVDLKARRVAANGVLLFEQRKSGYFVAPLSIHVAALPSHLYDVAAEEFGLDGTEEVFKYTPVEIYSGRDSCNFLQRYAMKHGCIGELYALDQIIGGNECSSESY